MGMIDRFKRPNNLLILNSNRCERHNFLRISEENIQTKYGSYGLNPNHGMMEPLTGKMWYFVNKDDNNTFNPSTIKSDFRNLARQHTNYLKLHLSILKLVRNHNKKNDDDTKTLNDIKEVIYEFKPDKKIDSDNIDITPMAERAIIRNEVAKRLSRSQKISPYLVLAIMGCGALVGLVFSAWLGGENYDNRHYTQNDNYYQETDNETIVVSMMEFQIMDSQSIKETFNNDYAFIHVGIIGLFIYNAIKFKFFW